jgi:hypothetical protein
MYKITCCRQGKSIYRQNREKKGCFIKNFNTLSEIAIFFKKTCSSLFFPCLSQELTEKEIIILSAKLDSIYKKQRK